MRKARPMQASDLKVGVYVVRHSDRRMYEIEEVREKSVVLRNVLVPAGECHGAYGTMTISPLALQRDYWRVQPALDVEELERFLAA
jgi:hypothetical protein